MRFHANHLTIRILLLYFYIISVFPLPLKANILSLLDVENSLASYSASLKNLQTDKSITFWINSDVSVQAHVISKESPLAHGGDSWWIGIEQSTGKVEIYNFEQGTLNTLMTSNSSVLDNKWHLVSLIYESDIATWKLYIDNNLEETLTSDEIPNYIDPASVGFGYYSTSTSSNNFYNGSIGEYTVSDVALTADQIAQKYNSYESSHTVLINTTKLKSDFKISISGSGVDESQQYNSGSTIEIVPSITSDQGDIYIHILDNNGNELYQLKCVIDNQNNIQQVIVENQQDDLPLNSNFYKSTNNQLNLFLQSEVNSPNVLTLSGVDQLVKNSGENVVVTGAQNFPDAKMLIYAIQDQTTPIKQISGTLEWDGTDSNNSPVQGVFLVEVKNGQQLLLKEQIIVN